MEVKYSVIGIAIALVAVFCIFMWFFPSIYKSITKKEAPSDVVRWRAAGFYLVLSFAIIILISAFLPFNWGKVLREIAYIVLFIFLLIAMMVIVLPFVNKIEIPVDECEKYFFPSESNETILYNVIDYTSCVLTGYYPKTDQAGVTWTTFYIFYLILPFAFIFTIVYGVMKGIDVGSFFGSVGGSATKVLSFIISIYATRVLMGKVILEFLGYGAWGFGALFGAIFLVKGLQLVIERWYGLEKETEETRKAITSSAEVTKAYARSVEPIIQTAKSSVKTSIQFAKTKLGELRTVPQYIYLSDVERNYIDKLIETAVASKNKGEFNRNLDKIEKIIKDVFAKEKT